MRRYTRCSNLRHALVALVALATVLALGWAPTARAAVKPAFASVKPLLELEGAPVAWVRAYEGGASVVAVASAGGDSAVRKGGLAVRYEELTIEVDLQMEPALTSWVAAFLAGKAEPKSGAIVSCDMNLKAKERFTFTGATLRKVRFSALDASAAKTPLSVTLVLAPARTQLEMVKEGTCKSPTKASKAALPMVGNFRFDLDGVDGTGVIAVDGLEVERTTAGGLGVSRLQLKVQGSHAAEFLAWHEQAVRGKPSEKKLSIALLDQQMKDEVGRFDFGVARSVRCARERVEAGTEKASSVLVELHVDSLGFTQKSQ